MAEVASATKRRKRIRGEGGERERGRRPADSGWLVMRQRMSGCVVA